MKKIYIEVDKDFRVTKVHRMPFDPNNGMGYTKEELDKRGFFVESIANPVNKTGMRSVMMYNPDKKEIYYDYVGIPMSNKERLQQLENAMDFIARNALYGANPANVMSIEEDNNVEPGIKAIGEYIAYRVICGHMDARDAINNFPQCESVIIETLRENGVQI